MYEEVTFDSRYYHADFWHRAGRCKNIKILHAIRPKAERETAGSIGYESSQFQWQNTT